MCYQILIKVSTESVVKDYDKLSADEVDKTVGKLMRNFKKSFQFRSELLQSKFKILQEYPVALIKRITFFEQCRHCIVHNFGVIDKQFIEKTGAEGILLNTKLRFTESNINELDDIISNIQLILFSDICYNILDKKI